MLSLGRQFFLHRILSMKYLYTLAAGALAILLTACGGENAATSSPSPAGTSHYAASAQEASAFLARATFGANMEEIAKLRDGGTSYEQWIENQFLIPPTYHMAWAQSHAKGAGGTPDLKEDPEAWKRYSDTMDYLQQDVWWQIVTKAPDQLRQRVALALSELFVISKYGPLATMPDSRVSFYDLLVKNAFSNFETLLNEVTWHPAMGRYLSYLGNAKADPQKGNHPDENYAREVMQLFTIGLYRLNPDGSFRLDSKGKKRASYTQKDIREMARVFTGLTDANGFFFAKDGSTTHASRTQPMIAMETYHDKGEKKVLTETIEAGGSTKQDIRKALHLLFMHENTAPFIARQLIQRLVTSNPSAGYIGRVAAKFIDNGNGVRGDMRAVIKAVLLDEEALKGAETLPERFGKFREPLLYITHLFRAYHAEDAVNTLRIYDDGPAYRYRSYHFHGTGMTKQEAPLEALTVFNYFTPDDGPWPLKRLGLVAPELELYGKQGIDDLLMGLITKNGFIYRLFEITAEIDIETERSLIAQKKYDALLERLDILLTGGAMSEKTKQAIKNYLIAQEGAKEDNGDPVPPGKIARYAIGAVMTSPDYALQR